MGKVVITQFSDPMMGLSWECEPAIRRVEEELGDGVVVRDRMGPPGETPSMVVADNRK